MSENDFRDEIGRATQRSAASWSVLETANAPSDATPCPPQSALDGVVCTKCGHVNPAGLDLCEQPRCHATLRGNRLAVTNALRATSLPPELGHLREEIAAYEASSLIDEGDPDDVPTRRRSALGYRARIHRRIVQLDDAIELRGLVDRRGRLRVAWLQRLEGLIATAVRLDALLGLARGAKRLNVAEQLAQFHRKDGR